MKDHIAYLKYVLKHKWFVYLACRKLHVSLWQSVIHDWSKFTPAEWFPYVRSFYNRDGSKRDVSAVRNKPLGWLVNHGHSAREAEQLVEQLRMIQEAFDYAWLHHLKFNPHHWQYWVLINDEDGTTPLEMPGKYVFEMIADWDGAGRAITGKSDPAGWYEKNGKRMILHSYTRILVEQILTHYYTR